MKDKIPAQYKEVSKKAIDYAISCLDANQTVENEEYEENQKALEGVDMPILHHMAGGEGGIPGGITGGIPGSGDMPDMGVMGDAGGGSPPVDYPVSGPTIEYIN